MPTKRPRCPFAVVGYCTKCLEQGQKVRKGGGAGEKCIAGHSWKGNMVVFRGDDIIRPLPENRQVLKSSQFCEHRRHADGSCIYGCQHATSQMESEIWNWMVENKVTTPEALVAASTRPPERAGSLPPAEGQGRLSKKWNSTENMNEFEDDSGEGWKTIRRRRHSIHVPAIKTNNRFDLLSQNPDVGNGQPVRQKTVPHPTSKRLLANFSRLPQRQFTPGPGRDATQSSYQRQLQALNSKSVNVVLSGTSRPKNASNKKMTQLRLEQTCVPPQLPNQTRRSSVQALNSDAQMVKNTFPLEGTHSWMIACFKCLQKTSKHSYYDHIPIEHSCDEDTLVIRENGSTRWQYVRVRLGQHKFLGSHYQLCRNYTKEKPCNFSEKLCSFAHHPCEQQLWTMERNGQFNITEFIKANRSPDKRVGYSLELLKKHGGEMVFLCKKCFLCQPARVSYQAYDVCQQGHSWAENKMMMHIKNGEITPINDRPFTHKNAYFNMCYSLNYCQKDICKNAHSSVERAVWVVENDMRLTRDQIQEQMKNASDGTDDDVKFVTHVPTEYNRPGAAKKTSKKKQSSGQAAETPLQEPAPQLVQCPYRVFYVCNSCRRSGQKVPQGRNSQFCAGRNGHIWKTNKVAVTGQHIETIRELPERIPRLFALCHYGRSCFAYPKCPFAHSEIEKTIWTWQVANQVMTLDQLVEISEKAHPARPTYRQQPQQTAAGPSASTQNQRSPLSNIDPYYCKYCATTCNGQRQWDDHCTSPEHVNNVNSDKDRQWNFRQPPWNIHSNYRLCRCTSGEFCRYRNSEDMLNACTYAHSQDELEEWNERLKWRRMKREKAKTEGALSYVDNLLEEYEQAAQGLSVLTDSIDDVSVNHESLVKYTDNKTEIFTWTFQVVVKSGKVLKRVALLNNKDRLHFELVVGIVRCQIRPGEDFEIESHKEGCKKYEIKVHFKSDMFGSFHQKIVFDFGSRPVLYKDIIVDVGTKGNHAKVQNLREQLKFDRWTNDNRDIVQIDEVKDPFDEELLKKYKDKDVHDIVTQAAISSELKSTNYVHKMHGLLYLEEITQNKIISSFNVNTTAALLDTIMEETLVKARPGELFAHIKLDEELTNDTDAGGLILAKVRRVLISTDESSKKVYEVNFVEKEVYDFDGRGRDSIYLRLHQACCTSLQLSPNTNIKMVIQFQMDRKPFARMHFALDQLQNTDLLFPDLAKISRGLNEKETLALSSSKLNATQMKIVNHIMKERHGYAPPMIVYGPFGTGKTETLAQATRTLVENVPHARILICTMSNSAADVYVEKYLGDLPSSSGICMKRVVTTEKKPANTSQKVRNHCFLSEDGRQFVDPTRSDLEGQRIVITTFTHSLLLTRLQLRGYFTHIFIDEAGQALECEAMMPMLLAETNTCVVLAGDHIQISPKVYSEEAERQGFHKSLLERLFHFYEKYTSLTPMLTTPLHTLLHINYRSHHEIVQYLAKAFYNGQLVCQSMLPSCDIVQSMMLMAVQGEEVQDQDGRSYYNDSEAKEVSEAVEQLLKLWPLEWGEKRPETVAVVTPYQDQVKLIRNNLRMKGLKNVTVERVQNVQGKEFRAMFISTVRTYHICDKPEESTNTSDYGFLTDKKLLNTAMTRAQSLVAVVGDPIALCSIGDCLSVWRTFIEHCDQLGSIRPAHVNLGVIRTAVTQFLSDPKTNKRIEKINEQLKKKTVTPVTQHPIRSNMARTEDAGAGMRDNTVETDEILKQLALEVVRNQRRVSQQGACGQQLGVDEIRVECIRVKETPSYAMLTYSNKKPKRRLLGADDAGRDYDSDEDDRNDEQVKNYAELKALLKDRKKYKECIFHFDRRSMYADIIDRKDTDGKGRVVMSSRPRCGQAFDNDTVVVKILEASEEDVLANPAQERVLLGEVVGVLKRAIDPTYKIFVCTVDPNNTAIMAPINRGIPRIFNLSTEAHKHRKGHVNVYKFTNDHDIVFDRYEAIDEFKPKSKLFMVRYLKWEPGFFSPLGIVVDILEEGTTVEKGLKIVNAEHRVHHSYNSNALSEVEQKYPDGFTYPADTIKKRTDLRDLMVFAIDPEGCQDVDDCLSLEAGDQDDSGTNTFIVGVHIADVSHFIERGSALDEEAKKRGTSLYPPGSDPVHMLPEALSTDILSLHEGKDKLTLSVFITVDGEGKVLNVEPKRCIVKSKCQLSYQEAEMILHQDSTSYSKELKQSIWGLYLIAQQWRRQRQGTAALYLQLDEEDEDISYAHLLVSEMMVMANQQVALYLFDKYPDCTPLRRQLSPNVLELDEWRKKYAVAALNSLVLRRPFIPSGWTCECEQQCECVGLSVESSSLDKKFFDIKTEVWQKLMRCMNDGDVEAVRNLILKPENHPQLWVAQSQYRKILNMADYVCSDKEHEDINWHYSENMPKYTHFTSPIRRYIDIVVHRLLVAAMQGSPCPYGQEEITEICNLMTAAARRGNNYEQTLLGLHMGSALKIQPQIEHPVVDEVDDHSVHFSFLNKKKFHGIQSMVNLSELGIAGRPEYIEAESRVLTRWQQRIYNLGQEIEPREPRRSKPGQEDELVRLNPNRFVLQIPAKDWQKILQAVQADDLGELAKNVAAVRTKIRDLTTDKRFVKEVTSEMKHHHKIMQHHCHFEQTIQPGHVKEVQLAMGMLNGLMVPRIQLINLSPNFHVCIEHLAETQNCFARLAVRKASCENYNSIEAYQRAWLPVLAMESATGAIRNDENFQIRNVTIQWTAHSVRPKAGEAGEKSEDSDSDDTSQDGSSTENTFEPKKLYKGVFRLSVPFCQARHIKLSTVGGPEAADTEMSFDYMCIRYPGITPDTEGRDQDCVAKACGALTATWVGHCLVTKVDKIEAKNVPGQEKGDDMLRVRLKLHQSSMPFPSQLLHDNSKLCTVEFMPKSLPDRRMETAVRELLENANSLARQIALKKSPSEFAYALSNAVAEACKVTEIPGLQPPNQEQRNAIRAALTQKFTLIQGPPGTGKTATGALIAYLFSTVNRKLGDMSGAERKATTAQVLYCGPSNKSVDVVAGYLKRLKGKCPGIVRVYSELIEHKDFPLPGEPIPPKRRTEAYENSVTKNHKDIALHFMIRQNNTESAKEILAYDKRFREEPTLVTAEEVEKYQKLVTSCEVEIMKKAAIILCTCTASASYKMKMTKDTKDGLEAPCSVNQVIIDECGMCQEPESMVPIVAARPTQVVLIGDHKQLRPIILNDTAKRLGLDKSLFERYSKQSIMLTVQYRMHTAISEFPSNHFYEGKLRPGLPVQHEPSKLKNMWPGPSRENEPIGFCHVMGQEEALAVSSAEGNEQSKKNQAEAEQAVKYATLLIYKHGVYQNQIVILSQYRAQCAEIEKLLKKRDLTAITVSTVVTSQGSEWDYVILSTVRSLPRSEIETKPTTGWMRRKLGFITDENQINVALTRARKGLIIIGNKYLLKCDKMWNELLKEYEKKGKIVQSVFSKQPAWQKK